MKFDFPGGEHDIKDGYRILTNLPDNTLSINFEYFFGGNVSLIFDKTDISRLEDHIKYFIKREKYFRKKEENENENEIKIINKRLKDFTNRELHNICQNHRYSGGSCSNCPLHFITKGLEDEDCCVIRDKRGWIWRFGDYRNFFTRLCLYGDREITVKESDLKDG